MKAEGLDLQSASLAGFWKQFDPELASLISDMDQAEDWTLDREPELGSRLVRLGHRLATARDAQALASAPLDDLRLFFGHISTSRYLRVIQWMDEMGGLGTLLVERLLHAPTDLDRAVPDEHLRKVLHHRLQVISNTQHFTSLFAPERLKRLERAIRRYRQEIPDAA